MDSTLANKVIAFFILLTSEKEAGPVSINVRHRSVVKSFLKFCRLKLVFD